MKFSLRNLPRLVGYFKKTAIGRSSQVIQNTCEKCRFEFSFDNNEIFNLLTTSSFFNMSASEDSSNLLWKRTEDDTNSIEDVWDDSALVNAYDRVLRQVEAVVVEKISGDIKHPEPSARPKMQSRKKTPGRASMSHERNSFDHSASSSCSEQQIAKWKVGHFCRCLYSIDEQEYEAQIISINTANETCIVQYIGYGNEEEKLLSELRPSLGKIARKKQIAASNAEVVSESENEELQDKIQNKSQKPMKRTAPHSHDVPPWFPPPLSSCSKSAPFLPPPPSHVPDFNIPSDDDALASMLMSWYMSGYHTGYYRALKQSRSQCHRHCHH